MTHMTKLDEILEGKIALKDYAATKDEIKQLFAALVTRHTKDYLLIKKLRQEIDKL